jgi:hypothetical protein
LFALGLSYYDYAYDLLDTGRYYLAFERNPAAVATSANCSRSSGCWLRKAAPRSTHSGRARRLAA